jgi:hypothetical protein
MIFLASFSTSAIIFLCAILVGISGCAVKSEPPRPVITAAPDGGSELKIAVLPVVNISGTPAPIRIIHQALKRGGRGGCRTDHIFGALQ